MPRGPAGRLLTVPGVRRSVVLCAVAGVLTWALLVVQWALVAAFVAAVVDGARPAALAGSLGGVAAAWLARAGVLAVRDRAVARTSARVRRRLRGALLRKLVALGPAHAGAQQDGELVTTVTEGVGRLDGVVGRLLPGATAAAVVPPLVAATVLVLDPASALILLLTGPLVLLFLWLTGTLAARAARAQWETLARLGASLADTLRVLPTLVAYGRARSSARWLTDVSEAHRVSTMRVLRTAFLSGFVLEFGAVLCTALVAVTVGVRLFEGQLTLQRALLVLLLTPEFFAPLRALGADRHAGLEGEPAAERVFALLDAPEPASGSRPVPAGVPAVTLRGVTLRHGGRAALDGVDLDLPPLSRTALVGPSGAGKTSLVRLLLGFAVPDEGAVLVDGVPLTELDPAAWRARVAHVPERPFLLPGSVADNVRLGRPDATAAEVERALARAGLLEVVRRLPQGTDTPLGEDAARLSGGERVRLALARALVKDAGLLVLDEPTGQLDEATEQAVLAALEEAAAGRTVVTVTHRTAPLALHDRVVALADGALALPAVPR
ncbi:ATP-binding cassette subfamily C protein CydD [Geodermatophilus tzadiensis]|uniref:ATP-binding cassette subfamily C protein CydD n=1 Tax=Geodermatophilus tzadiensis TaxID=1137988 RepID=A0A2T0TU61_9ACTN|nr:thiol reductant ABC exporter subunit CydD [Geodermatophilus tzadiensis]PRY49058.1 ATP-binding cassette subfamily C protein CydD [Geodermatophilus tzadiensis]